MVGYELFAGPQRDITAEQAAETLRKLPGTHYSKNWGKLTLKDLSKLLGLSVSTISKALNDSHEIREETRLRVKNAAILINYILNRLAQSLKANKTETIGVIIPDVLVHFFAMAIHGIETTASNYGYKVFICLSNESLPKEAESMETLIQGNVDGVIISLSRETPTCEIYDHFEMRYNSTFR